MTTLPDTRLREGAVLETLDVSQKRLRALRREVLQAFVHFGRDAAGIWFTPEALVLLRARLDTGKAEPLPLDEGEPETVAVLKPGQRIEDDRLVEDLLITRVWPQRERMVLCQRPNGLEVVCQVQSSENLRSGMQLKSCHRGEYQIWYYTGRLPRSKRGGRCLGFFPPR